MPQNYLHPQTGMDPAEYKQMNDIMGQRASEALSQNPGALRRVASQHTVPLLLNSYEIATYPNKPILIEDEMRQMGQQMKGGRYKKTSRKPKKVAKQLAEGIYKSRKSLSTKPVSVIEDMLGKRRN
jgi:hypothetical protein